MSFNCPFCSRSFVDINKYWKLIEDGFPVSEGHHLLIPKRHIARLEDLSFDEFQSLGDALQVSLLFLTEHLSNFKDYNVGINNGSNAGQTINHLHIHIIPRTKGDVPNPLGGVRGVIPTKKEY